MRILIYSPLYLPSIGGLETVVALCAEGFARHGHEIVVVTRTATQGPEPSDYLVVRRPSLVALLRWVSWCDVYFQANVSLRGLWPLLLLRRPWVVSHHTWYRRADGRIGVRDRLKRWLLRYAQVSISVSKAMAADLDVPSIVIENPYRDTLFRQVPGVPRTKQLIFVGRLVSDKGVDVLLEAMYLLKVGGHMQALSVFGEGPEQQSLEAQARRLGLESQVVFGGIVRGEALVSELNSHRVMIIPSRYNEPFGVVALEAIACGCVVVGSAGGGLPEAIGNCGRTFPNGDARALAQVIQDVLLDEDATRRFLVDSQRHLTRHASHIVIRRYLEVMGSCVRSRLDRRNIKDH